nr:hypothetical protein [Pedobacter kyonggii]
MARQTKTISNAWEAEEMMLKIMIQQDRLRIAKNSAALKAKNAVRDVQYRFYMCQVVLLDNQLVEIGKTLDLVSEFLKVPA